REREPDSHRRRLLTPRPTLVGVLECVINVSEGRDMERLRTIARASGPAVAEQCSIVEHAGEHPRFGALDVVPFVALGGTKVEREQAAEAARAFGEWWANEFAVPVFLYDDADPDQRDLPGRAPPARRGELRAREPRHQRGPPDRTGDARAVGWASRRPRARLLLG